MIETITWKSSFKYESTPERIQSRLFADLDTQDHSKASYELGRKRSELESFYYTVMD